MATSRARQGSAPVQAVASATKGVEPGRPLGARLMRLPAASAVDPTRPSFAHRSGPQCNYHRVEKLGVELWHLYTCTSKLSETDCCLLPDPGEASQSPLREDSDCWPGTCIRRPRTRRRRNRRRCRVALAGARFGLAPS